MRGRVLTRKTKQSTSGIGGTKINFTEEEIPGLDLGYEGSIFVAGGLPVFPDKHCLTWTYAPHDGWRGFLIKYLRIPKSLFKPERKDRVFYVVNGEFIVCSYESYAWLKMKG